MTWVYLMGFVLLNSKKESKINTGSVWDIAEVLPECI